MMMTANEKRDRLYDYLIKTDGISVAYSAGVDSTFLLKAAHDILGDKAIAVTAVSPFFQNDEYEEAVSFCKAEGIRHIIINTDPLGNEQIASNPPDRCYLCKKAIFEQIKAVSAENGIYRVADGSNTDDDNDYRPGRRALRELGIESPLKEAGLSKADIRELSKALSLPTWDKPALACLATRIATGERLTPEKLSVIDSAESFIRSLGIRQVRVRMHGSIARIETERQDILHVAASDNAERIDGYLRSLGFTAVTLDLGGYRTGSMNIKG